MAPQCYSVVVTLPGGRELNIGSGLTLPQATRLYHSGAVRWAGVIREEKP